LSASDKVLSYIAKHLQRLEKFADTQSAFKKTQGGVTARSVSFDITSHERYSSIELEIVM